MHYNGQKWANFKSHVQGVKWQNQTEQRAFSHLFNGTTKISTSITKSWSEVTPPPPILREYGRLPAFTNLPHRKVAAIQTCPKYKLAPLFVYVSTVRAWFVLVVFYHRSNVYPDLQVMVLVNKRRDRSMLCVLSHVNMPLSYIDLLLFNAIQRLQGPTLDGLVAIFFFRS